jgi:hypothetical protein
MKRLILIWVNIHHQMQTGFEFAAACPNLAYPAADV